MSCRFLASFFAVLTLVHPASSPVVFASSETGDGSRMAQLGEYEVGFRVLERYDHSRPFASRDDKGIEPGGTRARPIQISLWYPAAPSSRRAGGGLTFGDYVELMGRETELEPRGAQPKSALDELRGLLSPSLVPELGSVQLEKLLAAPCAAVAAAPPSEGRFPLLLWGKGEDGHAVDHALFNELLASHGFAVASTPATPAYARRSSRYDALSVRTQLRDLEFTIQALHSEPYIDLERIGVLAWSFGGLPVVLLQMRNPDVGAIVSLDSRIGYRTPAHLFIEAPGYSLSRMTAPLLHLTGSGEPQVERLKDGAFFESIHYADTYLVTLENVRHRDFNFLLGTLAQKTDLQGPWPVPPHRTLALLAQTTLPFLNATLRADADGKAALAQLVAPEPPSGISGVTHRPGRPAPPSRDDFMWVLNSQGVEAARALWQRTHAVSPQVQLFAAEELLRRSRDLLRGRALEEAEALTTLIVEAYPTQAMGYYLLAQVATSSGRAADAQFHYRRCLEVLSQDSSLDESQRAVIRRDVEARLASSP